MLASGTDGHAGTADAVGAAASTDNSPSQWVTRLTPRTTGLRPASHPETIAAAEAVLGSGTVAWAVELGHEMSTRIIAEIPALGVGDNAFEVLRPGPESAVLRSLLLLVADDTDQHGATVEALEGDRDFVRRGVPLDQVLRGIRLGHSLMASGMLAAIADLVPEPAATTEMKRTSELLFEFIDEFASNMTTEYLLERDRWVATQAAARGELVSAILDGTATVDAAAATSALSYPLAGRHIALCLTKSGDIGPTITVLQTQATDLLKTLGCTTTLLIPQGAATLWAWGAAPESPPTTRKPLRVDDVSVTVGVGGPCRGVAGFRQSHSEAIHAQALAAIGIEATTSARIVTYQDVEVVALLAADLPMARAFVHRRLGPLAAHDRATADLRATLLAYLQTDRSLIRAAEQLHVARNTVAYRIKKIQDLLGSDLRGDAFELTAALALTAMLPGLLDG